MSTITVTLTPEQILAMRSVVFFTQSVLQLRPPKDLEPQVIRAYYEQAETVQKLVEEISK